MTLSRLPFRRVHRPWPLLLSLALLLDGCDPCLGIAECAVRPHIGVSGQILNDTTGRPERGATVDLVWTGGVRLARDSARVTTDANGLFHFDVAAAEIGQTMVNLIVRPRSSQGYRVRDLSIPSTGRRGEALVFPPWSNVPHLPDFGELYRRGGARETLPHTEIAYRVTGGIALESLSDGIWTATTNAGGIFPLFGDAVRPLEVGDVIGDLIVFLPDPPGISVHRDFRVRANAEYRYGARIHRVGAGPNLDYRINVNDRGRFGDGVAGVRLEFVRTGGVELDPPNWTLTTDGDGNVHFPSRALAHGVVRGNLTITPPGPWKAYTRMDWTLPTFDGDNTPLGAVFAVGPRLPYYLIIRANGIPAKGILVDFHRTGGINVDPSTFPSVTNDSGIVALSPQPEAEGEVVVDITVRPPPPYTVFIVRNVRLQALDAEVPGGRVLIGDWELTNPPTSPSQVP